MSKIIVGFGGLTASDTTVQLPRNDGLWVHIRHLMEVNPDKSLYPNSKAVITAGKITSASFVYFKDYPELAIDLKPGCRDSEQGLKGLLPYLAACVEYRADGVRSTPTRFIKNYQDIFQPGMIDWKLYAIEVDERDVDFCYVSITDDSIGRIRLSGLRHILQVSIADEPDAPKVEIKSAMESKNSIMAKRPINGSPAVPCTLYVEKDQRSGRTMFTREYPRDAAKSPEFLGELLAHHDNIHGFYL